MKEPDFIHCSSHYMAWYSLLSLDPSFFGTYILHRKCPRVSQRCCLFIPWNRTNQTTIENISPFLLLRYLPTTSSVSPDSITRDSPPPSAGSVSLNSPNPPRSLSLHPVSRPDTPPDSLHASFPPLNGSASPRNRSSGPGPNALPMYREHQLTSAQRRAVRHAHSNIRPYDVGFRANWAQILGVGRRGWRGWVYRILCGGGGAGDGKTFPRNPKAGDMLAQLAAELASEDKTD